MHCELAVPALFGMPGAARREAPRLPALERLLARGRRAIHDYLGLEPWLAHAFNVADGPLAAGALTALAEAGATGDAYWLRADPVHLRVGQEHAGILPAAALGIAREEAEALAEAINVQFGAESTLYPLHPQRWCLRLAERDAAAADAPGAPSPLEIAGARVEAAGSLRWQARLTEWQMVLHAHPVNAARAARGEPALNSVWFWGPGRLPARAAGPWQSVAADEPIARGLARRAGIAQRALPAAADVWRAGLGEDGRHLAVLDALRLARALGDARRFDAGLQSLESQWFAPLLAALRAGDIGMVTLHVPEAGLAFETIRGDLRRFWRRPRPLAAYEEA